MVVQRETLSGPYNPHFKLARSVDMLCMSGVVKFLCHRDRLADQLTDCSSLPCMDILVVRGNLPTPCLRSVGLVHRRGSSRRLE